MTRAVAVSVDLQSDRDPGMTEDLFGMARFPFGMGRRQSG
jgi:hypothetical protein